MKYTFNDFLSDQHAKQYNGLDDHMPDNYADWVGELSGDEAIEYAEKHIEIIEKEKATLIERIIQRYITKPVRLSKCCYAEVDCQGGGYDGEDIVELYDICEECKMTCDTIFIKPEGWVDEKLPF